MVQSTESREGVDRAISPISDRYWPTGWRILRESEVRPIFMVIANLFGHQPLEVLLIPHDHVVQPVSSATPDPALGDAVLPRTAKGSADGLASQVFPSRNHIDSELRVVIEQKESVRRRVRPCLPQLLPDPESIGISGHLPPIMAHDKEAIQNAERERRCRKEVHGSDGIAVIP